MATLSLVPPSPDMAAAEAFVAASLVCPLAFRPPGNAILGHRRHPAHYYDCPIRHTKSIAGVRRYNRVGLGCARLVARDGKSTEKTVMFPCSNANSIAPTTAAM